jgi:hypothetical protein
LFTVAGRFAAVAGVLTILVLFFVFVLPASRQSDARLVSPEITGSTKPTPSRAAPADNADHAENGSKPALAEFRALLASPPASAPPAHEKSQLLQEFLQWRQKAASSQ